MNDKNSYPIVQVKTKDDLSLFGLHIPVNGSTTVFLHVHGTASNFYEEYFIEVLTRELSKKGISMLSTNNRGVGVYDAWQGNGAAVEKFADCVTDIDAWIEFALDQKYEKIILSGHSLGTEKVAYYMTHGEYRDTISALVLLAPATSPGSEALLKNYDQTLETASTMIKEGRGEAFLERNAYADIMPKSAVSYVDFSDLNSQFDDALPFHKGKLPSLSKIKIPSIAVIGDQEEYTVIPIKDALALINKENPAIHTVQILNCDHDFQEKEKELASILISFFEKTLSQLVI